MTKPLVFERKKRGRKLILFLERRLSRMKWKSLGWDWSYDHLAEFPKSGVLHFYNNEQKVRCFVSEHRPDVITCNGSPNIVEAVSLLLEGYSPNPLIEIVK